MHKTATKIDVTPIITAIGRPLPTNDHDFLLGWLRGQEWYHKHDWDRPIDDQYVIDCVVGWYQRGLFAACYQDVLFFHVGFVVSMVTLAEQEKN